MLGEDCVIIDIRTVLSPKDLKLCVAIREVSKQLYCQMMQITLNVREVNMLHSVEILQKDHFSFNFV